MLGHNLFVDLDWSTADGTLWTIVNVGRTILYPLLNALGVEKVLLVASQRSYHIVFAIRLHADHALAFWRKLAECAVREFYSTQRLENLVEVLLLRFRILSIKRTVGN